MLIFLFEIISAVKYIISLRPASHLVVVGLFKEIHGMFESRDKNMKMGMKMKKWTLFLFFVYKIQMK